MSQITRYEPQALIPRTIEEAERIAERIADSNFCPKDHRGKPGDVLVAIMMGAEVGLSPMQAIQNISVINGKPNLWGDAMLALCQSHPLWGGNKEATYQECLGYLSCDYEGLDKFEQKIFVFVKANESMPNGNPDKINLHQDGYISVVLRKGDPLQLDFFGKSDAVVAGLWNKQGPWTQYPKRMLQMRSRGFSLRNKFADALKGLITREEAEDMPVVVKNVTSTEVRNALPSSDVRKLQAPKKTHTEMVNEKIRQVNDKLAQQNQFTDKKWALDEIEKSQSLDDLDALVEALKKLDPKDRATVKEAYLAKEKLLFDMFSQEENDVHPGQEELFIDQPEELQPATGTA